MFTNDDFTGACINGDLSEVKALLRQGFDIHKSDGALIWAARFGHLDVVKYLAEQGADIHALNDYTLKAAANHGHLDVVKYLVEQGANIHAEDDLALKWAARYRHLDVVNFLREAAGSGYKCHGCLIKSTCLELCEDFRPGGKIYKSKQH